MSLRDPAHAAQASSIMRWQGTAFLSAGDSEAATDCYTVSICVAELAGDELNQAHTLNAWAALCWQGGELDRADDLYSAALAIANKKNDARLVAMVRQNQGVVSNIRGDLEAALAHYNASLALYRDVGESRFLPMLLNNLGMIYTDLRDWDKAETSFTESAELCEAIEDLRTRVMVETNLAELFCLRRNYSRARESCDAAFEIASRIEHQLGLGEVYKWYGVVYRETGKFNLAEAHLRNATSIAERYSSPLLAGEAQRELAEVYRFQDKNRDALLSLNYAHRVFNDLRAELDLADTDRRLHDLEEIFLAVVRKWAESIESKDRYTAGHCERVADYGTNLARAVGFDEQTLVWFRMGAFLHDVGKTAIPAELLNKQGTLDKEEWALMQQHTLRGVELLEPIDFPWDILPMVRSHHERWDGRGYPDGLSGRAIPLSARILCVADVFDALTTTRSYRNAFTVEEALRIMAADSGKIFDPELFALFQAQVDPEVDLNR